MSMSRVTRNYQVTIPKDVRETENIRVGDVVMFVSTAEGVKLTKAKKDILEETCGMWSHIKGSSVSYVRHMRKESEKREKRLGI